MGKEGRRAGDGDGDVMCVGRAHNVKPKVCVDDSDQYSPV